MRRACLLRGTWTAGAASAVRKDQEHGLDRDQTCLQGSWFISSTFLAIFASSRFLSSAVESCQRRCGSLLVPTWGSLGIGYRLTSSQASVREGRAVDAGRPGKAEKRGASVAAGSS